MDLADYADLSRQADEYGIFRFVLTGGEAMLDKNFEPLVAALNPDRHLIILDTNGWHFDEKKSIGLHLWAGTKRRFRLIAITRQSTTPLEIEKAPIRGQCDR